MSTINLTRFFSINASELRNKNEWSDNNLKGWNKFIYHNCWKSIPDREVILPERRKATFYDIVGNIHEQEHPRIAEQPKVYKLMAVYQSSIPRKIVYLEDYYTAREEYRQIVRIHERMHAFHHVNEGGVWQNFATVSRVYKEFLAQLFTFKCVEGTYLEKYFRELSEEQPLHYFQV